MSLYLGENCISAGGSSAFRNNNIGQIIQSTIPLSDAGLHLLDGALISGSGSYADFVTYIAGLVSTYPDLFTTEANWQQSITDYGVCGKFVYDSVNNTVRLPKYSNKIYTSDFANTAGVKGNGITLGLTDGNYYSGLQHQATNGVYSGAINNYGLPIGSQFTTANLANTSLGITTDATKSGIIADLSNITTALDGYYYIVIATSTKTDIEVDIDEIATDLNSKADVDLSNCTKPHIVETYVNGTSWYRVYSDGWCEQGGINTTNSTSERTQSLLISYKDTNYSIQVSYNSDGTLSNGAIDAYGKAVGSFKLKSWSSDSLCWTAKGYIS